MRTSLLACFSLHRLAASIVALLAVFCASQADAGVVVALDASADYSAPASMGDAASQPLPDQDDAQHRALLAALLASSPTDGGMGTSSTTTITGTATAPALASLVCELPQPLLTAWLDLGQYLALPSLPPSGLFRPPRAA